MNIRELIASFLLAATITILAPGESPASCVGQPYEEVYDRADLIFSGVPYLRLKPPPNPPNDWLAYLTEYRFEVGQIWKGAVQDTVVLYSWDDNECGTCKYETGINYLIFAKERRGYLEVGPACSRSGPADVAYYTRLRLGTPIVMQSDLATPPITAELLLDRLASENREEYYGASSTLSSLKTNREWIVEQLGAILQGERPGNINATVQAIRGFDSEAVSLLPDLEALVSTPDLSTRSVVFDAISRVTSPEEFFLTHWPYMVGMDADSRIILWRWVRHNFNRLTPIIQENEFRRLEVGIIHEKDPRIRMEAVRVISWFRPHGDKLVPALQRIHEAETDEKIRKEIEGDLQRLSKREQTDFQSD